MVEKLKRLPTGVKLTPLYGVIALFIAIPVIQSHQEHVKLQAEAHQAAARLSTAASSASQPAKPALIQGVPTRVLIPRIGVDVAIVGGHYNPASKTWSVAHDSANYATNTPLANNQQGAPLVYGHWYDWVLGKTRDLQVGDIAYIYTDNNHIFEYTYTGSTTVNPTDTEIFSELASQKGLRLLTCEGTWAQHRRIMAFNLVGAV